MTNVPPQHTCTEKYLEQMVKYIYNSEIKMIYIYSIAPTKELDIIVWKNYWRDSVVS